MAHILTNTEEIETLLRRALTDALLATLPPLVREATRKPWLTKEELRDLTGWSDRTIQHLRDTRQIPFAQHGRKILYPSEGIGQFLTLQSVKVRTPVSRQTNGVS